MPRIRPGTTTRGTVSDFRRAASRSPIVTYRLADYNEVFSLYLDAIELALREKASSGRDLAADEAVRLKLRAGAE